jgi:hypothetical protein
MTKIFLTAMEISNSSEMNLIVYLFAFFNIATQSENTVFIDNIYSNMASEIKKEIPIFKGYLKLFLIKVVARFLL